MERMEATRMEKRPDVALSKFRRTVRECFAQIRKDRPDYSAKIALNVARFEAQYSRGVRGAWLRYGDTKITLPQGYMAHIRVEADENVCAPWEDQDGLGLVCPVRSSAYVNMGEIYLPTDRGGYAWTPPVGVSPSAMHELQRYLQGYINGDWHYVGITIALFDINGARVGDDALWGSETYDWAHLTKTVRTMLANLLRARRAPGARRFAACVARGA